MKRRLREAVRLSHRTERLCVDVVINPKKSLLTTEFAIVMDEVSRAFVIIEQKLTARPLSTTAALPKKSPERNSGPGTTEA
jgi:RNase P protein component